MIVVHRTDTVGGEEVHMEIHMRDDFRVMDVLGCVILGSEPLRENLESMLGTVGDQFPEAQGVRLSGQIGVHGNPDGSAKIGAEYPPLWYCAKFVADKDGFDDAARDKLLALVEAVWRAFTKQHKCFNGSLVRSDSATYPG